MPRYNRQENGSGERLKQPIYEKKAGKVQHGADGKAIIKGYKWKGFGYATIAGERVKTKWFSAATRAELDGLIASEVATLERTSQQAPQTSETAFTEPVTAIVETPILVEALATVAAGADLNAAWDSYLNSAECRARDTTKEVYKWMWETNMRVKADLNAAPFGETKLAELSLEKLLAFDRVLNTNRSAERKNKKTGEVRVEEVKAVSPKYFAELRNLLRMACNHAQRYSEQFGAIGYHPGEYRPLRTWTTKPKFEAPTKSDFEAAITAAQELGFVEMVPLLTLIRYSFRPSEAVALKWEDWDENLHGFHIRRTRQRTAGGETVEAIGKTTASLDFMPLPKTLKVLVFTTRGLSDWVVPSPENKDRWIAKSSTNERWKKITAKIGKPELKMYSLKHGGISDLLQAGMTADQVILMTRHTTTKMVQNIYAGLERQSLADKFDTL